MANKSGINIKKSHKGLFTKKAKAHGMGVQQYAKYVLAHKDKFPASTRKQAGFAKASKKFKHQNGGDDQMQQISQEIISELQQGKNPNQILQELVKQGIPQQQAAQILQSVMQQAQGQQQGQDQQQAEPQMRDGGESDYPPVFTTPYEILKKTIKPLTQDYINYLVQKANRAQNGSEVTFPQTFRQYSKDSDNYGPEPDLGDQERQQFNQLYYNTFATPEQKTYAHNQELQSKGLMVPPQRPQDDINPYNQPYGNMGKKQKPLKTDFNPVFKDFNTLAQVTTGVANVFGDIKGKRKEHQDYLKSIQPRAYDNYQEEGLNNVPVYTQEGGYGYQTGGAPNHQMMRQQLMELINNYNKYVQNTTNRTAAPLDMKVMEHMRQAIDSQSNKGHFRMVPKESTQYPQYPLYGEPQDMPPAKPVKGQFGMGYANRTGTPNNVWSVPGGWGKYVYGDDYVQYGGNMKKGGLTKEKAREILHDGTVHGKKITDKQRRYFGAVASGYAQTGGFTYTDIDTPQGINVRQSVQTANQQNLNKNNTYPDTSGSKLNLDYRDATNQILTSGLPSTQTSYAKNLIGKVPNDYITSIDLFNQRQDVKNLTPEQKIEMFYNTAPSNPVALEQWNKLKALPASQNQKTAPIPSNLAIKKYGGLNEGDEVELTDEEIEELRKQGYEFEDADDNLSMFNK